MLIHKRRPRTEGNTRIKLRVLFETEKIEMVKKHRILGLTFDERLNWKVRRNQEAKQHKIGDSNIHTHRPSDQTIFYDSE
jgi:hypothetical protein